MKKFLTFLFAIVLLISASACGGDKTEQTSNNGQGSIDNSNNLSKSDSEEYVDLTQYSGSYYSPSGNYGITIYQDEYLDGADFWVDLVFLVDGYKTYDHSRVVLGEESLLAFSGSAYITLDISDDGAVHIKIDDEYNFYGNYEEDLTPGRPFELFGLASASDLNNLEGKDFFDAICFVEQNCIGMNAENVIGNYDYYSDGTTYRFVGYVDAVGNGNFLLKITENLDNNLILCLSNGYMPSVGDKICVYGEGLGRGTYTRTYNNGNQVEYETLLVNAGYIMENDVNITAPGGVFAFVSEVMCGEYTVKGNMGNPYYMEDVLTITNTSINGREFACESCSLHFYYNSINTDMEDGVVLNVTGNTTSKRGIDIGISFSFKFSDYDMSYSANDGSHLANTDLGYYYKTKSKYDIIDFSSAVG